MFGASINRSAILFSLPVAAAFGCAGWWVAEIALAEPPAEKPVRGERRRSAAAEEAAEKNSGRAEKYTEQENASTKGRRPQAAARWGAAFTAEREEEAIAFAKQHHPELARLLEHLKNSSQQHYRHAIVDLARIQQRLERMKEKDSARYEFDLKAWKLKSRILLTVAQLEMNQDDEQVQQKLKEILAQKIALEKSRLEYERRSLQQRLERIDSQLERLSENEADLVQRQFQQLLRQRKMAAERRKAAAEVNDKGPTKPRKK